MTMEMARKMQEQIPAFEKLSEKRSSVSHQNLRETNYGQVDHL